MVFNSTTLYNKDLVICLLNYIEASDRLSFYYSKDYIVRIILGNACNLLRANYTKGIIMCALYILKDVILSVEGGDVEHYRAKNTEKILFDKNMPYFRHLQK